ncbi:MAG: hypothetical protein JWM46_907 [Candidatus Kaiserbacteria bacterium]|nr:hypothetical protein [Candidatus Kaiserbacteria bacterium]
MNAITGKNALTGTTALTPLTRARKLEIAAEGIRSRGDIDYKTIRKIEDMTLEVVMALPVAGTVFQPIANALTANDCPTDNTVGAVMKTLELDQGQVHSIACACHENSEHMTGVHAANYLDQIRDEAVSTAGG